jgi:hypothetical protein
MNRSRIASADWSTINLAQLRRLPVYTLPPTYQLQRDCGNGCAGDPPGFPTYFTRAVYTQHGNHPPRGYSYVITGPETGGCRGIDPARWSGNYEDHRAKHDALMLRLWNKLPLDHPRTVAWIHSTFSHHRHCYHVPGKEALSFHDDDRMLIWPGGTLGKTPFGELKSEKFDVEWAQKHEAFDKWTPEAQQQFRELIRTNNARITRECEAVAKPENATATGIIRRYYPEFQPTAELFSDELKSPSNWWETLAECPAPENCPGQYSMAHPTGTTWCQFCGWRAPA